MCRVLILDDDRFGAQTVKMVIESNSNHVAEIVTTANEAVVRVTNSIQNGKPFDAFLIDLQLEDGENGIDVMKELKKISPDTETIIFTGYGDSATGLSAYQAGAFRYLAKPFDNQELLYLIDALREWRKTRIEHGWQKIFTKMMEIAMQQDNFQNAAEIIVNYSLKLGFKRAHLFWVPTREDVNQENLYIGIACAGHNSIPKFSSRLYPAMEWFNLRDLLKNKNAIFLRDLQNSKSENSANNYHFQLPALEAIILPIGRGEKLAGFLLLDFDQEKKTLSEHERSLLNLFTRQASVVLNRASLYGREQLLLKESSIIQNIGRQITAKAATVSLNDLLEEIRKQIRSLMDVSNFSVFLTNDESKEIKFHLLYDKGRRHKGVSRSMDHGFEEYLLTSQKEVLLLRAELKTFIQDNQIDFKDPIPMSFLGVPLRVEEKTIGGIIIRQYKDKGLESLERNIHVLLLVANQVAGAIQISQLAEAERENARRLQVLQKASTEMLRIAQENVEQFWLTLLTIVTSSFGLGFNRALLFLEEENFRRLRGRVGVGTEVEEDARYDWKRDEKRKYDFESFLADLGTRKMRHTPFEALVRNIQIDLSDREDAIQEVIRERAWQVIQAKDVPSRLPDEITHTFSLSTCAILPLRAGRRVLGVVIVDNKHNREPLKDRSLDRLQSILDNAGLVYETLQEQKKSTSLLNANYEILSGAKDQHLRETLSKICTTAKSFTDADWVIILPLLEEDPHRFDVNNIGFAGTLNNSLNDVIEETSHFGGISQHVLKKNTLVIRNIEDQTDSNNRQLKISDHHFIKSEGVKALIGAAIRNKDEEKALGLLYFDYRQPRKFSHLEQQQALSFASLAGVAISNARRMDELHQRRQLRTAKEIAETVGLGLNLEKTMEAIIQILHTVFEKTRLCVLLYQDDRRSLKFAPATLQYYKVQNPNFRRQDTFPLDERSIACRVARQALQIKTVVCENIGEVMKDPDYLPLNPRVQSELCVSLMSTRNNLLGVLALERDKLNGFDVADVDLVKTVAQQLSIAIERAQQIEELAFRSTVAAQTAWAAEIAHEINNQIGNIMGWAYLLRNNLKEETKLRKFAEKIEASISILSNAGPWSDQPSQLFKLDAFLEHDLKKLINQQNLMDEFHLGAQNIYVQVSPIKLQHVFRHLTRNAARAMDKSKVKKLIVRTEVINDNTVEIMLQDTGPGLTKEAQLSIFHRPYSTKNRGGHGLLFVRQMVEDMQGQIRHVPQKNLRGAVFSIRLPIASRVDGAVE